MLRAAARCEPVYETIRQSVAQAAWVVPDETGWRVGGHPAWLHTLVGPEATAYVIDPTRSGDVAADILGFDYAGTMIHDGWSPYDRFHQASHQQCLRHLLRRADDMEAAATRGAVCFPRRVAELLRAGLDLRDRHAAGAISTHGLAVARGRLENQLADVVFPPKTNAANEVLAKHLWADRDELFTFLRQPGLLPESSCWPSPSPPWRSLARQRHPNPPSHMTWTALVLIRSEHSAIRFVPRASSYANRRKMPTSVARLSGLAISPKLVRGLPWRRSRSCAWETGTF